ncbi:competence protein CoiA family protein [Streptomyces sp. NPDC020742]|uniref:competence protein CoiA family protein n=1 Tax=Streptomyces sp. NPDC020742 TaxID=3154897 RepID=UPI0033D75CCB
MPFTALHPDAGRLDATQDDLGCGMDWSRLHKARPRIALTCPECGWGVHAKRSPHGVRFFCHDPGRPPSCALSNESWEHHMLKLELAGAIRAAGWYAELEVAAADGTWRADVMASSPDGARRMAWEAQLSPITVEDIQARTARYRAEGIAVCWVCPHSRAPQWMGTVPAIRVRAPEAGDPWTVDDGIAGFDFAAGSWVVQEAELQRFVQWTLLGQVLPCRSLPRYRPLARTADGQPWGQRDGWWTSRQSARAQAEHEEMRQRQEKAEREREARKKEQESEAARKRAVHNEEARQRRAERDRRRRQLREKEDAARKEEARRLRAEHDARHARELAERTERERRERTEKERHAVATAKAWWDRLSREQLQELLAAVADRAWREERLRVDIPDSPGLAAHFAYGIPLHSRGPVHALYGIVRPCPQLVSLSPQLSFQRAFVRNAREAGELSEALTGRITHFDLPDPPGPRPDTG